MLEQCGRNVCEFSPFYPSFCSWPLFGGMSHGILCGRRCETNHFCASGDFALNNSPNQRVFQKNVDFVLRNVRDFGLFWPWRALHSCILLEMVDSSREWWIFSILAWFQESELQCVWILKIHRKALLGGEIWKDEEMLNSVFPEVAPNFSSFFFSEFVSFVCFEICLRLPSRDLLRADQCVLSFFPFSFLSCRITNNLLFSLFSK